MPAGCGTRALVMGATLIPDRSAAYGRREIGESQARLVQPKRLETVERLSAAQISCLRNQSNERRQGIASRREADSRYQRRIIERQVQGRGQSVCAARRRAPSVQRAVHRDDHPTFTTLCALLFLNHASMSAHRKVGEWREDRWQASYSQSWGTSVSLSVVR
jgi:hypothetical protein